MIRFERLVGVPSIVIFPEKLPVVEPVELVDFLNDNVAFTSEVFAVAPFEVEVHSIRPVMYLLPVENSKLPLAISSPLFFKDCDKADSVVAVGCYRQHSEFAADRDFVFRNEFLSTKHAAVAPINLIVVFIVARKADFVIYLDI